MTAAQISKEEGQRAIVDSSAISASGVSALPNRLQEEILISELQPALTEDLGGVLELPGGVESDLRAISGDKPMQGKVQQIALLCYSHAVIGCGYFVLQVCKRFSLTI